MSQCHPVLAPIGRSVSNSFWKLPQPPNFLATLLGIKSAPKLFSSGFLFLFTRSLHSEIVSCLPQTLRLEEDEAVVAGVGERMCLRDCTPFPNKFCLLSLSLPARLAIKGKTGQRAVGKEGSLCWQLSVKHGHRTVYRFLQPALESRCRQHCLCNRNRPQRRMTKVATGSWVSHEETFAAAEVRGEDRFPGVPGQAGCVFRPGFWLRSVTWQACLRHVGELKEATP